MRTIFLALLIVTQVLLYGLRWWHSDVLTTDFPYFFVVARLYESGENPYDLNKQCEAQAAIRNEPCAGYAHAPILLPLLASLFNDDMKASFWRWTLFQILLLILSAYLLYLLSNDIFGSMQCVLFPPIIGALLIGNDTIFILTAILAWALLLLNKRDLWAGVCLSLAVLKPHIALPLAIPLLVVRPRAFIGFCIGGFVLTTYSFAIVGIEGFRGMIDIARSLSQGSTFGGVSQAIMFNTTGLFARAGLSTIWAWPIYLGAIGGLTVFVRKYGINRFSVSVAVIVTVFTCPHLFFYDLAYLVLPLITAHPLAPMVASLIAILTVAGLPWWTVYLLMAGLMGVILTKRPHRTMRDDGALM